MPSEENFQALFERCNRSKRDTDDTDDTDFRRWNKALEDKLIDKHSEFISEDKVDEEFEHLAGMIEIILSLAEIKNSSREELLDLVNKQKMTKGGYERGYFYQGDEN